MGILSVRTPLCKITSTGEIEQWFRRAASMKVVQFLKLDACQSDGCVLWQQNFVVQCKDQLTISLIYGTLILLWILFHTSIIKQKDEQATPLSGKPTLLFQRAILQRPLLGRSRNEEKGSSHEQLQHRAASSRNIRTIFEYRMTNKQIRPCVIQRRICFFAINPCVHTAIAG